MVSEAEWEEIALDRLYEHGWETIHGSKLAPGAEGGRTSWDDIVLRDRTLAAMRKLNPLVPGEYLEQALAEVLSPKSQDAIAENYRIHEILVNGYRGIAYLDSDGIEHNPTIRFVSHNVDDNELLAINQVTIRSSENERRFDIVLYLNGLPVVIFEMKKAGSENADITSAHAQLATYLREFPMAFRFAVLTIITETASPRDTARHSLRSITTRHGTSTTAAVVLPRVSTSRTRASASKWSTSSTA